MKNSILLLVLVLVLSYSCSDNQQKNSVNLKINAVLNEKNYDSQKLMYQMLSKNEQYQLWKDKIEKLVSDTNLNNQQITLINDLKNHININLFEKISNNDEKEVFKSIYVKDFLNKAKSLFTYEYVYVNFFTINGNISLFKIDDIKPVCSCNQSSIWSCAMGAYTCKETDKCRKDSDGCGFLGFYECNGNCFNN
jgi:hypothetical protein